MRAAIEKQRAAVAKQRESVRKQAETAGVWLVPLMPSPVEPEASAVASGTATQACDPIAEETVGPLIAGAAKTHGVDPRLVRAVIDQESRFYPCALSPKGAIGLMQLMPETARELGVEDPFDAKSNIEAGTKYLKQMLDRFTALPTALAAYNIGPAAVAQVGGTPAVQETTDYVKAILQKLQATPTDPPNVPPPKPTGN